MGNLYNIYLIALTVFDLYKKNGIKKKLHNKNERFIIMKH